jgi:HK97 family phage portal protein
MYETSAILHMVASKIGDLMASLGWHIGVLDGKVATDKARSFKMGDFLTRQRTLNDLAFSGGITEIPEHPFLDMINGVEGSILGRTTRKIGQVHYDLVGEFYYFMLMNEFDIPVSWYPIPPTLVTELPSPDFPFYKITFGNITRNVEMDKVFHVKDANPMDPYGRGIGTARSLADEIVTDEHAAKFIKNFFAQGAKPPLIITAPDLTEGQGIRASRRWDNTSRDSRRSWRPKFMRLPEGGQIKELTNSFTDGDVTELRSFERDTILQTFGISPEIFGILTDANRASAQEARRILAESVIVPRAEVWREAFQTRLLPRYDKRLVVWYDDPRPEDKDRQIRSMRFQGHFFTQDEHRRAGGHFPLGPENGGDMRAVPANLVLVDDLSDLVGIEQGAEPEMNPDEDPVE